MAFARSNVATHGPRRPFPPGYRSGLAKTPPLVGWEGSICMGLPVSAYFYQKETETHKRSCHSSRSRPIVQLAQLARLAVGCRRHAEFFPERVLRLGLRFAPVSSSSTRWPKSHAQREPDMPACAPSP